MDTIHYWIYGPIASGKTTLARHLAHSIASQADASDPEASRRRSYGCTVPTGLRDGDPSLSVAYLLTCPRHNHALIIDDFRDGPRAAAALEAILPDYPIPVIICSEAAPSNPAYRDYFRHIHIWLPSAMPTLPPNTHHPEGGLHHLIADR